MLSILATCNLNSVVKANQKQDLYSSDSTKVGMLCKHNYSKHLLGIVCWQHVSNKLGRGQRKTGEVAEHPKNISFSIEYLSWGRGDQSRSSSCCRSYTGCHSDSWAAPALPAQNTCSCRSLRSARTETRRVLRTKHSKQSRKRNFWDFSISLLLQ